MAEPRIVFLDPDESLDSEWLFVIVEHPTGVTYQQQCGGTACRQERVEGYLVPVPDTKAVAPLRSIFEGELGGAGVWNSVERIMTAEQLSNVRDAVASIRFSQSQEGWETSTLRLDEARLSQLDEAWLPVQTSDGPGWLVWSNSD